MSVVIPKLLVTTKKSRIFQKFIVWLPKKFWSHQYSSVWFNKPWWKSLPYGSNNLNNLGWQLSFILGGLGERGGESGTVGTDYWVVLLFHWNHAKPHREQNHLPIPPTLHFNCHFLPPSSPCSSPSSLRTGLSSCHGKVLQSVLSTLNLASLSSLKSHSATNLRWIKSTNWRHVKD